MRAGMTVAVCAVHFCRSDIEEKGRYDLSGPRRYEASVVFLSH
jgi:hypothetical protein